ncbi:thiol-disulfide isomerase/thioredoxin [Saccharomonospora amisosensis]|uniref:Thiol-disulfide isomerase/thioredoxin n=1 Tax=Saccharomonospora amisosensis TaxID=1128677 RepID=A0A7X5UW60_9PSEU|nr:TlpA disulfide reductase family protein [Saccharomonospora amisosensis]NIJ14759.1 thiol-disulfide isomerase/thioredoxin [Saccharomonospora amisosensis]
MRKLAALAAVLLLTLVTACSTGEDAVSRGSSFTFVSPGGKTDIYYEGADRQPLPEVEGEDLFDENKRIAVSDFKGKVVVINIWGQWCGPCRTEAPELQKVYEQTKHLGVQVLGIDVRDYDRSAPRDFMRDRGLTYPSIYDPPGRSLLKLTGYPRNVVPSTIVVDSRQRVAAVFLRDLLAPDILPLVRRLAQEGGS